MFSGCEEQTRSRTAFPRVGSQTNCFIEKKKKIVEHIYLFIYLFETRCRKACILAAANIVSKFVSCDTYRQYTCYGCCIYCVVELHSLFIYLFIPQYCNPSWGHCRRRNHDRNNNSKINSSIQQQQHNSRDIYSFKYHEKNVTPTFGLSNQYMHSKATLLA